MHIPLSFLPTAFLVEMSCFLKIRNIHTTGYFRYNFTTLLWFYIYNLPFCNIELHLYLQYNERKFQIFPGTAPRVSFAQFSDCFGVFYALVVFTFIFSFIFWKKTSTEISFFQKNQKNIMNQQSNEPNLSESIFDTSRGPIRSQTSNQI